MLESSYLLNPVLFFSCRPGVVKAIEEFKESIYGDDSEEESDSGAKEKSRKRKAADAGDYDFVELAKTGKVKPSSLTLVCVYIILF